jgi:ribosomal protein S18 acetylase RimI-like enzyme
MALSSRPFAGEPDLVRMQSLAERVWLDRGELAAWTPGDLAWWFHGPSFLKHDTMELWEEEGRLVAWGWVTEPADLDVMIDPSVANISPLLDAVLEWLGEEAARRAKPGEPAPVPAVWAMDFDPVVRELEARGYRPGEKGFVHTIRSLEDPFADWEVPSGYRIRPFAGDGEIDQRVDVHRAAFAPSRMTVEVYRKLVDSRSYREMAIDMVAEAPDGSLAAFCICWNHPRLGVAELEPVGTHPDHQRRGLARLVCAEALREAARRGATTGLVDHTIGAEAATNLYEHSMGFKEIARHRRYER